ncbi:MAG: carboxypeptidase-like regulatory domain-containing protein [Planctomycetales bacterium]|nr:carboxypeptidase-like regulatory domain-containing protein [Planctomycetales bacterium]
MKDESIPLPPSNPGQSRDEIAAEIADHLAASEAELVKKGSAHDEARTLALKKFGDIEKIQKNCYWIQNGEAIMMRWTFVSLAAVLCILLGLSVLSNWRTQSQLADEMGKLSAELKAMAAAQQAPPTAPQPPEITGVIYAGSKDKPAIAAPVTILRANGSVVRATNSDEKGNYRSGPLEPGDYCVMSSLIGNPSSLKGWVAQSEPIFLHNNSGNVVKDLDTVYHSGGIKIVLNRKLPEVRKDGHYLITSRLGVFVVPPRRRNYLWTPNQKMPEEWPVYCSPAMRGQGFLSSESLTENENNLVRGTSAYLQLLTDKATEVREYSSDVPARFPVGSAEIELVLYLTVLPIDKDGNVDLSEELIKKIPGLEKTAPSGSNHAIPWSKLNDEVSWSVIFNGQLWMEKLIGGPWDAWEELRKRGFPVRPPREKLQIRENQFTTLQVEILEGLETEIQKAVDETTDAQAFADLLAKGLLRRPVKIIATTHEPMNKEPAAASP